MRPLLEGLETRVLPAARVNLVNGLLAVVADNRGDNLTVSQSNGQVLVTDNVSGQVTPFSAAAVTSVSFLGGNGGNGDTFVNTTALPDIEQAGYFNSGLTYLQGGTSKSILIGSFNRAGATYETAGNGNAIFIAGAGFTNAFGGKSGGKDTIIGGPDGSTLYAYDILGTNTFVANQGKGYLIVNAQSTVSVGSDYSVVTFFQTAQTTPTGNPFLLQNDTNGNGILYLNPQVQTSGVQFYVTQVNGTLFASYTDVNGTQTAQFPANQVAWIASFGTPFNDVLYVDASVSANAVLYGSGGNDFVHGGSGIDVLKSHSGSDVLDASAASYADLSAGANGTDILIGASSPKAFTVFRNRANASTIDVNVGNYDLVTSPAAQSIPKYQINPGRFWLHKDGDTHPLWSLSDLVFADLG